MKLQDTTPTGIDLEVNYLRDGSLQVKAMTSIAIYAPGEFIHDSQRDELHLPLSRGAKIIPQPFPRQSVLAQLQSEPT